MKDSEIAKALEGHPNAAEILEVLGEDPEENHDRREGYVVGSGDDWLESATGHPELMVHQLSHWKGGWDAEQFERHQSRHKSLRATHGLQFLERPNHKGRYVRRGPKVRAQIQENYREQVKAEQEGETWQP